MIYQKAEVKNGKMVIAETKVIDQSKLTGDCFYVQINGLEACKTCEFRGTDECGGGATLKKLKAR
jgi:hypothetical protein